MTRITFSALLVAILMTVAAAPVFAQLRVDEQTSGSVVASNVHAGLFGLDWTSDASGFVRATVTLPRGILTRSVTKADDGATSPTGGYDVRLLDVAGMDLLGGLAADLETTTTQAFTPFITDSATSPSAFSLAPVAGPYELEIDGAGDERGGLLWLNISTR